MVFRPDPTASRRLSQQARRDTGPEIALRQVIWSMGYRYRLHVPIEGTRRTIDIALRKYKVAVFVDGCFWHGCPIHGTLPKNNPQWWRDKIQTNKRRDMDTTKRLKKQGWTVIRIWEHELPVRAAQRVRRAIEKSVLPISQG